MQALLFLAALAAASAVDCRKRVIPNSLLGPRAPLPLLIAALIQPECMGGGDIKLTAAAGFVLGFWQGFWGLALGLLLAVLYFCITRLYHKIFRRPHALTGRTPLPFGPFLSIGFAALYCFGG